MMRKFDMCAIARLFTFCLIFFGCAPARTTQWDGGSDRPVDTVEPTACASGVEWCDADMFSDLTPGTIQAFGEYLLFTNTGLATDYEIEVARLLTKDKRVTATIFVDRGVSEGSPVAIGDRNGDGVYDLAIPGWEEARGAGILVAYGPFEGEVHLGAEAYAPAPYGWSILLDADGDGAEEPIDPTRGEFAANEIDLFGIVAFGDLNNDGTRDLAATTYSNEIAIVLGGHEPLEVWKLGSPALASTIQVRISDMDGDGADDLQVNSLEDAWNYDATREPVYTPRWWSGPFHNPPRWEEAYLPAPPLIGENDRLKPGWFAARETIGTLAVDGETYFVSLGETRFDEAGRSNAAIGVTDLEGRLSQTLVEVPGRAARPSRYEVLLIGDDLYVSTYTGPLDQNGRPTPSVLHWNARQLLQALLVP